MKIPVIVEDDDGAFGATSPEFPNIFAIGSSQEEVLARFKLGVEQWLKLIRKEGGEVPELPHMTATMIEIEDVA